MSIVEAISVVLGIVTVTLAVRRSVWNFPVAIVSVSLLGWVVYGQRLYSDALLQGFFVAANVYGWIKWTRAEAVTHDIPVERLMPRAMMMWVAGIVAVSIVWATLSARYTDATLPWWDAPTFVASVAGQILMGQRRLENWIIWIGVDLALIPLYAMQQLYGLAVLYVVYLFLSVWGLVDWSRAWSARPAVAA